MNYTTDLNIAYMICELALGLCVTLAGFIYDLRSGYYTSSYTTQIYYTSHLSNRHLLLHIVERILTP